MPQFSDSSAAGVRPDFASDRRYLRNHCYPTANVHRLNTHLRESTSQLFTTAIVPPDQTLDNLTNARAVESLTWSPPRRALQPRSELRLILKTGYAHTRREKLSSAARQSSGTPAPPRSTRGPGLCCNAQTILTRIDLSEVESSGPRRPKAAAAPRKAHSLSEATLTFPEGRVTSGPHQIFGNAVGGRSDRILPGLDTVMTPPRAPHRYAVRALSK